MTPIPLQFWRSNTGREPTRDWFRSLSNVDRAILGLDLKRVQFGWPIGMPLVKAMGGGLWEVRTSLPSKREARTLLTIDEDGIVILHAFIKKTQKTPKSELDLALKRMREFEDEN